jgi:RNase P/RNase MRP subunit POP5
MINEIRKQCKHILNKDCKEMGVHLVRFDGRIGIIKCNHIEKENTIKLLKSINEVSSQKVKIETIGTSGTIKALVKKHMNN